MADFFSGFTNAFVPIYQQKQENKRQKAQDEWARQMQEQQLAYQKQQQEEEQRRYDSQYTDVTPEMLANLPENLRAMYQPGSETSVIHNAVPGLENYGITTSETKTNPVYQKILRSDYAGYLSDADKKKLQDAANAEDARRWAEEMALKNKEYASNEEQRKIENSQRWAEINKTTTKTPTKSPLLANLEKEYANYAAQNKGQFVNDTMNPGAGYWTFPNGSQALGFNDWVAQNKTADTYNQVQLETGGQSQTFTPTKKFLSGTVNTGGGNSDFGQIHALKADRLVSQYGDVAKAILGSIPHSSGVDDATLEALVARYNGNSNTNYTSDQWIAAYNAGVTSPKFLPQTTQTKKK